MRNFCYFIILSIFIIGCSSSKKKKLPASFDWNDFITQELKELDSIQPQVLKTIYFADTTENISNDSVNFSKELAILKHINWNPKQILRYRTDSSLQGDTLTISYVAKDTLLPLKSMRVVMNNRNQNVYHVQIKRIVAEDIYQIEQLIDYKPRKSFTIQGKQSVPYLYKEGYDVKYEFLF